MEDNEIMEDNEELFNLVLKKQVKQSTKSFRVTTVIIIILICLVGGAIFALQNYELYIAFQQINSLSEEISQYEDTVSSLSSSLETLVTDSNDAFSLVYDTINQKIDDVSTEIEQISDNVEENTAELTERINNLATLLPDDRKVYESVEPSIVAIKGVQGEQISLGSGIIATEDGYIVTCSHVVSSASSITVTTSDGNTYYATRLLNDDTSDIAILKITGNVSGLKAAAFGSSNDLYIGQTSYLIGYASSNYLNGKPTFTKGLLSGVRTMGYRNLVQTSADANHGNSGGALVDTDGKVIGMLMGSLVDTTGMNFCITVEDMMSFLNDAMSR